MKHLFRIALCLLFFANSAYAADESVPTPFSWPQSYSYTTQLTSRDNPDFFFANKYNRDGLKARNENAKLGVMIFRLDKHKRITIRPNGTVQEATLPANWPMSNIYPANRPWLQVAHDTINGQSALKYKITRDAYEAAHFRLAPFVIFWLSEDRQKPIRMEDGDMVLDFSNYSVGDQDPKLFEPLAKAKK